jgi:outer membrane receptor for ferrienterochelin and colicins
VKPFPSLPGANVFWKASTIGTVTDVNGIFSIPEPSVYPAELVVSYVGFKSDTILVTNSQALTIVLKPAIALKDITVEGRKDATLISTINPLNTELIGTKELLKAACCNLSESFETSPSVVVAYTDAITGAKEIQMLGLSGIYSQLMTENIPSIRGLGATYGLNYVPGPWMESIQVTKGSGSVANGFESTTGQINIEYLKPDKADKMLVNGYVASSGNVEFNMHQTLNAKKGLKGILFLHGENSQTKWDEQDDGFLDEPLVSQANVFNRWSFNDGKKFEGQFGIKGLYEKRKSGQLGYVYKDYPDSTNGYGVQVETKRFEVFSKSGMVFPETPWKSMGLILSSSFHDQQSYFGLKTYEGIQMSFYGSLIYMSIIKNTNHKWKAGLDIRSDNYDESFLAQPYNHSETIPGAYFEYTLNARDKFGLVAGSRIDHHNKYGFFYTPRLHMKYNFTPDIIARVSAGRSFRTANVFADNISVLATSRDLLIEETLNPERAWNAGINATAKFRIFYREGSLSVDYYLTDFSNQVIVDPYLSPDYIYLYNLKGNSTSRSFQVAFNYEAIKRLDVRLAYKNDNVVIDYHGVSTTKPLVAKERGLLNLAYSSKKENYRYDFTAQYQGKSRLAIPKNDIDEIQNEDSQIKNNITPSFFTYNAQVTYILKQWEFYAGVENLSDFKQKVPVMNPSAPFDRGFDATNVWGPVMGRKLYAGFRYTIKQKKATIK